MSTSTLQLTWGSTLLANPTREPNGDLVIFNKIGIENLTQVAEYVRGPAALPLNRANWRTVFDFTVESVFASVLAAQQFVIAQMAALEAEPGNTLAFAWGQSGVGVYKPTLAGAILRSAAPKFDGLTVRWTYNIIGGVFS
jgi:hypothetical protein